MHQAAVRGAHEDAVMDAKPQTANPTEHLTRPEALQLIRGKLKGLTDDENCMCLVAARIGVFCKGFHEIPDVEFRRRFDWIARKRPKASREELERLVSLYHRGRQEVSHAELCCDVETREHSACDGWNSFGNAALAKLCFELTGRTVEIL
jgi:hypothetical protein